MLQEYGMKLFDKYQEDQNVFLFVCKGMDKLDLNNVGEILHNKEKEHYYSIESVERKKSYLFGRYCVKRAMILNGMTKKQREVCIDYGEFNHPIVTHGNEKNIQVSLSHSNDVAVSLLFTQKHILGIDIEKITNESANIMSEILFDKERNFIQKENENIILVSMWSAKEALAKSLRIGFSASLKIFEISEIYFKENKLNVHFTFFPHLKVEGIIINDYVLSIACLKQHELVNNNQKFSTIFIN
ncbi:4'-phosphopantetheinyl transferase superfamily protein [Bacillus thuringiensis]|uniref:4'-phosphopantetheinyl transferase family protein n=1 Tax=Bacillus thuringiensis TaxID=1428 RepID=UPI002225564F|nr:4'-phosphopantetheinyl transferase superfamily protein [Bacillus thuringiensis]UYX52545.1 4'-phosphopantetheinyl transferase superfamily protein [Bacillus thuringiensis]